MLQGPAYDDAATGELLARLRSIPSHRGLEWLEIVFRGRAARGGSSA